jgi:Flp pilus assembly protein TadG
MERRQNSERGQAIVLLVVSLVVLLGFTALAIDGGMVYSDRRHAQNAADTASLAGGGAAASVLQDGHITYGTWLCSNVLNAVNHNAEQAAIHRAATNSYTIFAYDPNDVSTHDSYVDIDCVEVTTWYTDKYIDVKTQITADTQTSFAHLIYQGPLTNRVEAITRIRAQSPLGFGNALISLNPNNCQGQQNGMMFYGSSTTTIRGGGVLSLGCLRGSGNNFYVDVDGGVHYYGDRDGNHLDNILPNPPEQIYSSLDPTTYTVDPPNCSALPARSQSDYTSTRVLEPGRYNSIDIQNGTWRFEDGLYCINETSVYAPGTTPASFPHNNLTSYLSPKEIVWRNSYFHPYLLLLFTV